MRYITQSELKSFLSCGRRHHFAYERLLVPLDTPDYFNYGSAFHNGLFRWHSEKEPEQVLQVAEDLPEDDKCLPEKIRAQLKAYMDHYTDEDPDIRSVFALEHEFHIPMTSSWGLAGKMDGIVLDSNGHSWLLEHKTSNTTDPAYFENLFFDFQISFYLYVCNKLYKEGKIPHINGVLYNVVRKPSIRLKKQETPQEYEERLYVDMVQRPEFYFYREFVTRGEDYLEEFERNLFVLSEQMEYSTRSFNPTQCLFCPYRKICEVPEYLREEVIEEYYGVKDRPHQELPNVDDERGYDV